MIGDGKLLPLLRVLTYESGHPAYNMALDEALLFELPDALEDGGGSEADAPGDFGVRGPGALLKNPQDGAVCLVDHFVSGYEVRHEMCRR